MDSKKMTPRQQREYALQGMNIEELLKIYEKHYGPNSRGCIPSGLPIVQTILRREFPDEYNGGKGI
jgi:hypothetical protein